MRTESAISPQDYMREVKKALSSKEGDKVKKAIFKFIDLYCVPDYKAFMEPHMDSKFGRCFKEQWTQLCFRFRAVDPSDYFPNGVEMHYRHGLHLFYISRSKFIS